jgi:hypothetical protein
VSVARYVYVPEEWERQQRAASTRDLVIQIAIWVVFGGMLVAAAIGGMVAWSRGRYAPRLFFAAAAIVLGAATITFANGWPMVMAQFQTSIPLQIQQIGVVAVGFVGFALLAVVVGLAIGAIPHGLAGLGRLPDRDAVTLGVAVGLFGAGVGVLAAWLRTPVWASFPAVGSLGTLVPALAEATSPIAGFFTRLAIVTATLLTIERITHSWTQHRAAGAVTLALVGFLSAGVPSSGHAAGWAMAGTLLAAALVFSYVTLLRFDITLVPVALGTMAAVGAIARGAQRPFTGALPGSILAAVVAGLLAYWWLKALRSVRTSSASAESGSSA